MSRAAAARATAPNTNGPDDDAVIAVNLSKIRTAQDAMTSANGALRNIMGHAEGKGVHLKAAKKALSIVRSGDADGWLEETSNITRYLRILRHGIKDNQLNLQFESTLAPIEEKAALDGRSAGLDGQSEEIIPHALNTKAGQAWLTAFRQGKSERELILSMRDETEDDDAAADDDGGED